MYQKKREADIRCPLEYGMSLLEGKWKTRILCELDSLGILRFSELKGDMEGIADGVLASTLNELLAVGLVQKKSYGRENACSTYYSITTKGESLIPLLKDLCLWSETYYQTKPQFSMKSCHLCSCFQERQIN